MIMTNETTVPRLCMKTPLEKYSLVAAHILVAIISLVGNSIIVLVVIKKKELRTNVNYFIASMAVSDALTPLINLPYDIHRIMTWDEAWFVPSGAFGQFTCKAFPYISEVSILVSTFTLVTVAADRFYCVSFPLKASLISNKARRRLIIIIWIASMAFQSHHLVLRELKPNGQCEFSSAWGELEIKIQLSLIFVFQNVIPFIMVVALNFAIIFALNNDKMSGHLESSVVKRRFLRNRKISIMLVIIIVVYLTVWTPIWIFIFFNFFFPDVDEKALCYLDFVKGPVFFSFTAINPLLYYIFLKGFQNGIKEIFCCSTPTNKPTNSKELEQCRQRRRADTSGVSLRTSQTM